MLKTEKFLLNPICAGCVILVLLVLFKGIDILFYHGKDLLFYEANQGLEKIT